MHFSISLGATLLGLEILASKFKKKSIVVVGGYEVTYRFKKNFLKNGKEIGRKGRKNFIPIKPNSSDISEIGKIWK